MKYEITYFICPQCKLRFPIPRKKSHKRAKGHIKDIYCPRCAAVSKMEQQDIS